MQSVDFDALGDVQKRLERVEAGRAIMPGIPMLARLDGRAFHSYTKYFDKPFDRELVELMQLTTKALLDEFKADVGYTQSDEITLAWTNPDVEETKLMFGGKFQKLASLMAGYASAYFNVRGLQEGMDVRGMLPIFDCRVWQVPTLSVAAANFLWREMDATKNSVSMAASAYFSPKQLLGKSSPERREMLLKEKGIRWEDYPSAYKKGTYVVKRKVEKFLTKEELEMIKPEFRPVGPVLRSTIVELDIPPALRITNFEGVLFRGEEPVNESITAETT